MNTTKPQSLAELRRQVPREIRRDVEALYQELYQLECDKHERPASIRRMAWNCLTGSTPGYAPFWRHGFAKNYGKRVERSDYTAVPGYDEIHYSVALEFPEFDGPDGEGKLFDFLFSPYQPLPDRAEIYGRAWLQVEHDLATAGDAPAATFDDEPF